jgi:hypothetical protein
MPPRQQHITSEQLAYWYLRLNGFISTPNFVVHPDAGSNQETDVDVMGVRFPYRAENLSRPMKDDVYFARIKNRSHVVIAEVKKGLCALNGPWTDRGRNNMLRLLMAIGLFPKSEAGVVAEHLYEKGFYESQLYRVTLVCIGKTNSIEVHRTFPHVPQITWDEILDFIFRRFTRYREQKASHKQWDDGGKYLWDVFERCRNEAQYIESIQIISPD